MNSMKKTISGLAVLGVVALVLPGCDLPFFSSGKSPEKAKKTSSVFDVVKSESAGISSSDKSKVLVKVNGVPRITQNGLDEKLKQMLQANDMTA